MSQLNTNFQELISTTNNNSTGLENVTGTTLITSEALQGFSMANQFAICTGPGNTPVILSCIAPMFVPTINQSNTSCKSTYELTGHDNRGNNNNNQPQTVQIQLASPFNTATNAHSAATQSNIQSLGLSYINLSSLGAAQATGAIPIQITLNNPNQQIQIPASALTGLNQEIQLSQNYQLKYEPDLNQGPTHLQIIEHHPQHHQTTQQQQQQQQQQHQPESNKSLLNNDSNCMTITPPNTTTTTTNTTSTTKKKARRRIPTKSQRNLINGANPNNPISANPNSQQPEKLHDHKGRPFIYSCPHCPKKFTLNSRLTAHLRCHTGIRPYTCGQCGFSFTQKSYLIRHAAVHTEERPFTCERCFKTYKHYGSLANHRKLHRKEDKASLGNAEQTNPLEDEDDDRVIIEEESSLVHQMEDGSAIILPQSSLLDTVVNDSVVVTSSLALDNNNHSMSLSDNRSASSQQQQQQQQHIIATNSSSANNIINHHQMQSDWSIVATSTASPGASTANPTSTATAINVALHSDHQQQQSNIIIPSMGCLGDQNLSSNESPQQAIYHLTTSDHNSLCSSLLYTSDSTPNQIFSSPQSVAAVSSSSLTPVLTTNSISYLQHPHSSCNVQIIPATTSSSSAAL